MDNNDDGLIVCGSNMRFVRVGFSNVLIFFGVIFPIMLNLVLLEIHIGIYLRVIIVTLLSQRLLVKTDLTIK